MIINQQFEYKNKAHASTLATSLPICRLLRFVGIVLALLDTAEVRAQPANIPLGVPVGINLSAVNYYSTQVPFTDVFRNRDEWFTSPPSSVATVDGYPASVATGGTPVDIGVFRPIYARSYTVTWQGDGDLSFYGLQPGVTFTRAGTSAAGTLQVTRALESIVFLRITRSNANNRVRGVQIRPVGSSGDWEPDFLLANSAFRVLRFMDWGQTNGIHQDLTQQQIINLPYVEFSERTLPGQAEGTSRGVALETMVDLANKLKADLWYTVPPRASDGYMTSAAAFIQNRLDPSLKVYVEYGNENWNGIFGHLVWQQGKGVAAQLHQQQPYPGDPNDPGVRYWTGLKFSVRRAAVAHAAFRAAFGAGRVVAVVGGQSAFTGLNDDVLDMYENPAINLQRIPNTQNVTVADALAVAPYFGRNYEDPIDANLTVTQILDQTRTSIATMVAANTALNKQHAESHKLKLIGYEGGQHMLPYYVAPTGDPVVDAQAQATRNAFIEKLKTANRHVDMQDIYKTAHRAWVDNGGGAIVYFNSCEAFSEHGMWGALEEQAQTLNSTPKALALQEAGRVPERMIAIWADSNDRYVTAEHRGTAPLLNRATVVGGWERMLFSMNHDGSYSFKAGVNGSYVQTNDTGGSLIARGWAPGPWEKFDVVPTSDGFFGIRSQVNKKFVTFAANGTTPATPSANSLGANEKVRITAAPSARVLGMRADSNKRFVMADGNGSLPLVNNPLVLDPWERFELLANADQTVSIKSLTNNLFVALDNATPRRLIASQSMIGSTSKFELVPTRDGFTGLRSVANRKYVVFNPNGTTPAWADATELGPWEKLRFAEVPERPVALLAKSNARYVASPNSTTALINRPGDTSVNWEHRFILVNNGDGTVSLRDDLYAQYVCAESGGADPLKANRQDIGGWEKFQLQTTPDGYVVLKSTANNKYVTFYQNGTTPARAGTDTIGDWEKLTMVDL